MFIFFLVFPDLLKIIPASIHVSVILFCTVLIVFALIGTGFFMYNAFGNPYETLHGPVGLYLWSFISCKYFTIVHHVNLSFSHILSFKMSRHTATTLSSVKSSELQSRVR